MLDHRVEQHETVAVGLEGEVLELTTATVEAHQTTCLAEDRGELVHDTAFHATVIVLCSLTGENHIPLADLIVGKDVVQTTGNTAFHSG